MTDTDLAQVREEIHAEIAEQQRLESPGAGLIAAERKRQMTQEGWTPEHDDEHDDFALTKAADCYLYATVAVEGGRRWLNGDKAREMLTDAEREAELVDLAGYHFGRRDDGGINAPAGPQLWWPWEQAAWKPSDDPIRNLVRAGALIAAEIDRLIRAQGASR